MKTIKDNIGPQTTWTAEVEEYTTISKRSQTKSDSTTTYQHQTPRNAPPRIFNLVAQQPL
eukprot:6361381-Ditylum_brightwellii.AAC.1